MDPHARDPAAEGQAEQRQVPLTCPVAQANGTGLHIWPRDPKNHKRGGGCVDDGVASPARRSASTSAPTTEPTSSWDCHGGAVQRFQLPEDLETA
jgi:hypothetical protein